MYESRGDSSETFRPSQHFLNWLKLTKTAADILFFTLSTGYPSIFLLQFWLRTFKGLFDQNTNVHHTCINFLVWWLPLEGHCYIKAMFKEAKTERPDPGFIVALEVQILFKKFYLFKNSIFPENINMRCFSFCQIRSPAMFYIYQEIDKYLWANFQLNWIWCSNLQKLM